MTISGAGGLMSPVRNPMRRAPQIMARTWAFHREWFCLESFSETGCRIGLVGLVEELAMGEALLRSNLLFGSDYHVKLKGTMGEAP
jgi:hypothetical protein